MTGVPLGGFGHLYQGGKLRNDLLIWIRWIGSAKIVYGKMTVQCAEGLLPGGGVVEQHLRTAIVSCDQHQRLIEYFTLLSQVLLERVAGKILVFKSGGQFIENDDAHRRIRLQAVEFRGGMDLNPAGD